MGARQSTLPPHLEDLKREKLLGEGSFGKVWVVSNPQTKKKVALKVMSRVFSYRQNCVAVLTEIRVMQELCHDNLLSSLCILPPTEPLVDSKVSIMSELMDSTLQEVITTSLMLSRENMKIFMYQILRGVKYLHSAGVIHHDLKPANILVSRSSQVKICDFGLCRATARDGIMKFSKDQLGTMAYCSPELIVSCWQYSVEIDMWAVGCVFAEMLGRKVLFNANSLSAYLCMLTNLLGNPPAEDAVHMVPGYSKSLLLSGRKSLDLQKLHDLSRYTSAEMVDFLVRMLQFNPAKRASATAALAHSYLRGSRQRYHSYLCPRCAKGGRGGKCDCETWEPSSDKTLDGRLEEGMDSVEKAQDILRNYIISTNK